MRKAALLCAAVLAATTTTACSYADTTTDRPAASAGAAPAARWTRLDTECPALTSEPGRAVVAAGAGHPRMPVQDNDILLNARCGYGAASDAPGNLVLTVTVTIYRKDTTETVNAAAARALGEARATALDGTRNAERPTVADVPGVGDSAFALTYPKTGSVVLYGVSANAFVYLQYSYPQRDRNSDAANQRDAQESLTKIRTLAEDTLDDLR